jgi:hypothetical protein
VNRNGKGENGSRNQQLKISFIRIENLHSHDEEETTRLTLPQEATERTKQGETKNKTKNKKHNTGMNKSASLTPVRG